MDGAGDAATGVQEDCVNTGRNGHPISLPLLLIDGQDMGDDGGCGEGMQDLAHGMNELTTDDMLIEGRSSSPSAQRFEKIIGAIEDIVMAEEFQSLQNHFLSTYWTKFSEGSQGRQFDDSEEGAVGGVGVTRDFSEERHEHFKIFQAYSQEMAHLLETQLRKAFKDEHFDFNAFVEDLSKRMDRSDSDDASSSFLESEICEMLFTLVDFVKFKELFMDYKEMMEGKTPNLATGITLKQLPSTFPRH